MQPFLEASCVYIEHMVNSRADSKLRDTSTIDVNHTTPKQRAEAWLCKICTKRKTDDCSCTHFIARINFVNFEDDLNDEGETKLLESFAKLFCRWYLFRSNFLSESIEVERS